MPQQPYTPHHLAALLPADFKIGWSSSGHQFGPDCVLHEGENICDYARWAKKNNLNQPTAEYGYWLDINKHYEQYLDIMKDNGLKLFRFEVSWPLIQPNEKIYNEEILNLYARIFQATLDRGITPLICFHHYHQPCWFADRGGFRKEKNKHYFAQFCKKVYEHLMSTALNSSSHAKKLQHIHPLWATFNSPEGVALKTYVTHDLPEPIYHDGSSQIHNALTMLKNMCEAHVDAAEAIHAAYRQVIKPSFSYNATPQIGFLKNIHQCDVAPIPMSYKEKICALLLCLVANTMQDDTVFNFFTRGQFVYALPRQCFVVSDPSYTQERVKKSIDWIGLNYYSNRFFKGTKAIPETNAFYQTANSNYRIYPQGLLRALLKLDTKLAHKLHIPIYITETGLATSDNEQESHEKRNRYYAAYASAIPVAIKKGCRIAGLAAWAQADNYEWQPRPKNRKVYAGSVQPLGHRYYGLCAVKNDGTIFPKDKDNFLMNLARAIANNTHNPSYSSPDIRKTQLRENIRA